MLSADDGDTDLQIELRVAGVVCVIDFGASGPVHAALLAEVLGHPVDTPLQAEGLRMDRHGIHLRVADDVGELTFKPTDWESLFAGRELTDGAALVALRAIAAGVLEDRASMALDLLDAGGTWKDVRRYYRAALNHPIVQRRLAAEFDADPEAVGRGGSKPTGWLDPYHYELYMRTCVAVAIARRRGSPNSQEAALRAVLHEQPHLRSVVEGRELASIIKSWGRWERDPRFAGLAQQKLRADITPPG